MYSTRPKTHIMDGQDHSAFTGTSMPYVALILSLRLSSYPGALIPIVCFSTNSTINKQREGMSAYLFLPQPLQLSLLSAFFCSS